MRFIAAVLFLGLSAAAAIAQVNLLPRAAIEDGLKKAECTVPLEDAAAKPDSFDLGDGQTLFVVSC